MKLNKQAIILQTDRQTL